VADLSFVKGIYEKTVEGKLICAVLRFNEAIGHFAWEFLATSGFVFALPTLTFSIGSVVCCMSSNSDISSAAFPVPHFLSHSQSS
jgi:hypothetical protein